MLQRMAEGLVAGNLNANGNLAKMNQRSHIFLTYNGYNKINNINKIYLQREYFRCPPPIISIFGYV